MAFHDDWGISLESTKDFLRGGLPAILDRPSETGKLPASTRAGGGGATEATPPINAVAGQVPFGGLAGIGGGSIAMAAAGLVAVVLLVKVLK
ncbi:MAG: hypothetical protein COB30_015335 [Ectothiorhodospiraceae bacterium]|nr:hypothetical protein [Ectothiorhodospiraceae bacterium]